MGLFRLPEISIEEIRRAAKEAGKIEDPLERGTSIVHSYSLLVIDKMDLPTEKKETLIKMASHKMRLSRMNFLFPHESIPPQVVAKLKRVEPDVVKKVLETHIELRPDEEEEVRGWLKRIESGRKPEDVLEKDFLDRSNAAAEAHLRKVLGIENFVVWEELLRQVQEKARAAGLFHIGVQLE